MAMRLQYIMSYWLLLVLRSVPTVTLFPFLYSKIALDLAYFTYNEIKYLCTLILAITYDVNSGDIVLL